MIDRDKFEKWVLQQPYFGYAPGNLEAIDRSDQIDGGYSDAIVHGAWMAYCFAIGG